MKDPEYEGLVDLLNETTRRQFVKALFKHELLNFKSLYRDYLQISETNARHHLKLLLEGNIIQKEKKKGTKAIYLRIKPRFLERARRYFESERQSMYCGMVGIENPGDQVTQALNRLALNGWNIKGFTIFATEEAIHKLEKDERWLGLADNRQVTTIVQIPLFAFDAVYQTMKLTIENHIQQYSMVADVTGATKIHTLALFSLAQEYGFTRIYLPKDESNDIITLP